MLETEDMPDVETVGAFTNPFKALEFVKEQPVEAAFLDIEMPGMNGIELTEKLREIRPDLVVIFITGYENYTLDALKVKADYYLTKLMTGRISRRCWSARDCCLHVREKGYMSAPSEDLMFL